MSLSDPIADMLTRIRNAKMAKLGKTLIPFSNLKLSIGKLMKSEGYLKECLPLDHKGKPYIECELKPDSGDDPVFREIKRISKPSRRVYMGKNDIKNFKGGDRHLYLLHFKRSSLRPASP